MTLSRRKSCTYEKLKWNNMTFVIITILSQLWLMVGQPRANIFIWTCRTAKVKRVSGDARAKRTKEMWMSCEKNCNSWKVNTARWGASSRRRATSSACRGESGSWRERCTGCSPVSSRRTRKTTTCDTSWSSTRLSCTTLAGSTRTSWSRPRKCALG